MKLIFSEYFNETLGVNWNYGLWFSDVKAPASGYEIKKDSDGKKYLSLTWNKRNASPDTTLTSKFSFTYGNIKIVARWQAVIGSWPAFWMIPIKSQTDQGQDTGEIDIFEGQGATPKTFFGTLHWWHKDPKTGKSTDIETNSEQNDYPLPPNTNVNSWHTYEVDWTPTTITWLFDGKVLNSIPAYSILGTQLFNILLSCQVGNNWQEGDLTGVIVNTLTVNVKSVEVWQ